MYRVRDARLLLETEGMSIEVRTAYSFLANSRSTSRPKSSELDSDSDVDAESDAHPTTQTPTLPCAAYANAMTQGAIGRLISRITSTEDIFWSSFDCISDLYALARPESCLATAIDALALIDFMKSHGVRPEATPVLMLEAYGRALRAISDAMNDPVLRLHDETFLAVELICLFEAMSGEQPRQRVEAHHRGVAYILSARGNPQFGTVCGRKLFATSFLLNNSGPAARASRPRMPTAEHINGKLTGVRSAGEINLERSLGPLIEIGIRLRALASDLFGCENETGNDHAITKLLCRLDAAAKLLDQLWEEMCHSEELQRDDVNRPFIEQLTICHSVHVEDLRLQCLQILSRLKHDDEMCRSKEKCLERYLALKEMIATGRIGTRKGVVLAEHRTQAIPMATKKEHYQGSSALKVMMSIFVE